MNGLKTYINPYKPSAHFMGLWQTVQNQIRLWSGSALFAHRIYFNLNEIENYYPEALKLEKDLSNW